MVENPPVNAGGERDVGLTQQLIFLCYLKSQSLFYARMVKNVSVVISVS